MYVNGAISGDRNVIEKEAEKVLECKDVTTETVRVESINKSDTGNNWGKWNLFKIFQKIPEQYTEKARNQGSTENNHIGHCTRALFSNNVKVPNNQHGKLNSIYHELKLQNSCNTAYHRSMAFFR
jgi:hypothetical protein